MAENSMTTVENNIAARQAEAMQGELIDRQDSMELFGAFGNQTLRESHTFGNHGMETLRQIMLASGDDVIEGKKALNVPLAMIGYYCHEVDINDRNSGQQQRAIRTVIYTEDGKRFAFVSIGIARDLFRLTTVIGRGPWAKSVPVMPIALGASGNRQIYRLMPG